MAAPSLRSSLAVILALLAAALPLRAAPLSPAPAWSDGGLTRDSIAEATRPQPSPSAKGRRTSARRRTQTDPKDFGGSAVASRQARPASPLPVVTVQKRANRSPVTGFIYWWNGWVIRTFHTRVGTVLLGTIGAKT